MSEGSNHKQASVHLQRQRQFTRDQSKSHLMRGSLHRFGKYLLTRIKFEEDVDLNEIINLYNTKVEGKVNKSVPGLMYINWTVAHYFNMDGYEVRDKRTRKAEYIKVKHIAMYLSTVLYGYEYGQLLEFYGLVNHATVIHALENVEDYIVTDKKYKKAIEELTDKLLGYDRYTDHDENFNERSSTEEGIGDIQEETRQEGNDMFIYRNREVESSN